MTELEKYTLKRWGTALIIGLFSILLLYLNLLSPLMPGDDYLYSLKIPSDHYLGDQPIQSLRDYFESQVNHFYNYNYRVLPHAILQAILLLPPWLFDILNTMVFLALPAIIMRGTKVTRANYLPWYAMILLFLWIFHFDLGRSYFWTTGALNYSWILIPQLLYIHILLDHNSQNGRGQSKLLIFLALLIMMTNEQVVLSLFAVTIWIFINRLIKEKKVAVPVLTAGLILLCGGLIMYYSSSMQFRLEREGFNYETNSARWIEYLRRVTYYFISYASVGLILFFHGWTKSRFVDKTVYLISIVLLSMLAMSQAPLFEPRSAIFGFVVLLMATVQITDLNKISGLFFGVLILVSGFLFAERVPLFQEVSSRHEHNIRILEDKRGSQDSVYLDRFCSSYKYQCLICDDITDDPSYMDNEPVAAYYGIEHLVLKPEASLKHQSQKILLDFERGTTASYHRAKVSSKKLTDYIELIACHYSEGENLNMAIELKTSQNLDEHIVILRGSRKGINRYLLYDLIPRNWRLYFLDYLEYNAPINKLENKYLASHTVFEPNRYRYYLISLYNLNNHAPVGKAVRIEIPTNNNGQ
ncbi:MAG: hypothetical protein HKN09_12660 [Saprospiraceae bacterium]|nr:hypothetical protein [Saprospiraceae bacterium]